MYSRLYYSKRLVESIKLRRKTVIFNILFATTFFIPILLIVIGVLYYNECPIQPNIPKCLILGGLIVFFSHTAQLTNNILEILITKKTSKKTDKINQPYKFSRVVIILEGLGHILVFLWLILATALSLSYKSKVQYNDSSNNDTYCEKRCFEFLLVKPIIMWGLIILAIFIFLGTVIYGFIRPVNSDDATKDSYPIIEKD